MTSLTKIACAFVLAGGLAAPAIAAPGDAGSGPTTGATSTNDAGSGPTKGANNETKSKMTPAQSSMNNPTNMRISQKLRDDLGKAGFKDITIMPSSFLVRAKDSQGNPVMMVINPDSVTAITEETQGANSASNAHHNTGAMSNSNSAGATPGPNSTGGSQPVTPGGANKP